MISAPVIGIFGISGVGKSWLCGVITSRQPKFLHLQASSLLRSALGMSGEQMRTASSSEIMMNQQALSTALLDARKGQEDRPVLLDAHSVIDNGIELVRIQPQDIQPLCLTKMLFVQEDPQIIERRRSMDTRNRPKRTSKELEIHQIEAESSCKAIATMLGIQLEFYQISELDAIYSSLETTLSSAG